MVDTARAGFPTDMYRAADHGQMGNLESMAEEMVDTVTRYAHEKPIPAMLWALGIGFVLGWRLKPW